MTDTKDIVGIWPNWKKNYKLTEHSTEDEVGDYPEHILEGFTMTQDNGMSADDHLQEMLDKSSAEVNVLVEELMQCTETIKVQQEQIEYLEYLITRKAEVG